MLFSSLFKSEKQISVSKGRKRKLTIRDVVANLDKLELTTANCTLIRDSAGNAKIEDYGQVDIYRVRDEKVFVFENGFAITTPTGMKIREVSGNSDLAQIVAEDDTFEHVPMAGMQAGPNEEEAAGEEEIDSGQVFAEEGEHADGVDDSDAHDPEDGNDPEEEEADVEKELPEDAVAAKEEAEDEPAPDPDAVGKESAPPKSRASSTKDAYSDSQSERRDSSEDQDAAFGLGEVIRLRFFFKRIPFEIDCQILDRFNPVRFKSRDLTPRFGVGYHVRPLSDVRKRDQRRYVRYTHKIGFGHLRIRNEIQFAVYAHRTDLEIPERGVLSQKLAVNDLQVFPYGSKEVSEVKGAEKLENIVEFFMACMVNNPTERRTVYLSKPYLDRLNRSSLEGLGYYSVMGAQQATVLPKIFVKKQSKGKSVLERQLAARSGGAMDSRKLRLIEDIQDRYQLLTRERKIWHQKSRKKSVIGNWENDTALLSFSTAYGLPPNDAYSMRQIVMPCEISDIGVENITLKPVPFEDARSRELDFKEFVRQEDGFQAELLNFSVGGGQIRGTDGHEEAFLKYLVGDGYEDMHFMERVEALQRYAVLLHFYPVLNFVRSDIREYEPYLPLRIPVIARVARFRTTRAKDNDEPVITSLGLEFIYNPALDSYSRDINEYDQWEQITPYTENAYFIAVHKSLQLLFGFDRSKEESFREEKTKEAKADAEGSESAGESELAKG